MKKLPKLFANCAIALALVGWFPFCCYSATLTFSQVLFYQKTNGNVEYTVPAGTVWKITSCGVQDNGADDAGFVAVDGGYVIYTSSYVSPNNLGTWQIEGPIWVPAGKKVKLYASNSNVFAWVSIIEFTVG